MFKQCQQHLCRFSLSTLPRSLGASPFSYSCFLSLSLSLSLPLSPSLLFTEYSCLSFQASHLLTPTSVSLIPIKNAPFTLSSTSLFCSLLFSLFLYFPLGVMYMCNYYYRRTRDAAPRTNSPGSCRQDGSIRVQYVPSLPHGLTLGI